MLALLVLGGCAGAPSPNREPARSEPRDGPPLAIPGDLTTLPDPVPRTEPRSARGNPAQYSVFGETYRVMDSASGYYATGLASWYGRKFHGRTTSSGEPYDMFQLTAAHRTLPIPVYLKVTNLDNHKSTVVRVNDRGPFHSERIIDLSYAAAVKLGFADHGTARVRLEVMEEPGRFVLQAGAFRDLAAADRLKLSLAELTGQPAYVVRVATDSLYRVRLGPVSGRDEAQRLRDAIVAANLPDPLIIEE